MRAFVSFVMGVAVGAAAALVYAYRKLNTAFEEEIAEMKAFYESKSHMSEVESEQESDPVVDEYKEAISMYSSHSEPDDIEIIDPSMYDVESVRVTWTCYSDGVVADEEDDIVNDVEEILGTEWRNILMYSPCVYVRNNSRRTAYEIVADMSPYNETPSEG